MSNLVLPKQPENKEVSMGRAAKLKQQRHLQLQESSNSTSSKAQYLLFEPTRKNYLASVEALGGMERLDWCPHPGGAIKFATSNQAQARAKRIVKNRGYTLQVMEFIAGESQYQVKPVAEVTP
jgi:hypothetical protein